MNKSKGTSAQTKPGRASARPRRRRRILKSVLAVILLAVVARLGYGLLSEGDRAAPDEGVPIAEAMQGDLIVTVQERGDVYSMKPLEIKSQVEGRNTLLEIVDEGTVLTQKDVDEGRVIARLDSAQREEEVADRHIDVFQAEASYVQAKENYDIQVKQNESNIAAAELKVRFARLDAERYLGAELAARLLAPDAEPLDLIAMAREAVERLNAAAEASGPTEAGAGDHGATETVEVVAPVAEQSSSTTLGGDAEQRLRTLTSQVQLAAKELAQAQEQLTWSEKLEASHYISANELERDRIQAQRRTVRLRAAQEELELFLQYTLQKEAEQRLSDCQEAARDLERVQARARSQLTQSDATLKSREASYTLEQERLKKAEQMLENCTIRAPKPGRIAYGSSAGGSWGRRGRGQANIELGANIPENQVILRIPDLSALSVKLNISEKDIDKVVLGQPALIALQAVPGKILPGRVARISPMASATNAWLNPDTKVYEAEVALLAVPDLFIPGMSAEVRIVVGQLKDVVYMPVQGVIKEQGYTVCWVKGAERPMARRIRLGLSTGTLVEIKSGIRPGEWVYLAPPDNASHDELTALIEEAKRNAREEEPEAAGPPVGPPGAPAGPPASPGADVQPGAPNGDTPAGGEQGEGRQGGRRGGEQGLSAEERERRWQERLQSMTPEERKQAEERRNRFRNASPEERQRMRQQQGGGGEGAPAQQPASRPAEQGTTTDGTR